MTDIGPEPATVVLDGVLTIRTIAQVHAHLLAALTGQPAVIVDCAAATSVDLSLIQLLLAARLAARQAGKPFRLAAPAAGALRAALDQGGFGPDPLWTGDA